MRRPVKSPSMAGGARSAPIRVSRSCTGSASPPSPRSTARAMGLGCDMALCCDFIMASEAAVFGMSFILRGLVSDGGGLYFLPRRVGLPRAKELIFTGRSVQAQEALTIGLADRVASPDTLLQEARAWAVELSRGSPAALALTKSILDRTFELPEEQVFALGREAQAICYTTREHQESVAAFLEQDRAGRSTATWKDSTVYSVHAASRSSVLRPTRRS